MSDAVNWRERVDDVLWIELGVCARRTDSPASIGFLGPGPHVRPTGLEPIDAFEAIGLLDADEARDWRMRMGAVQTPLDVTPELRARLHRLLADLVRAALAAPPADELARQRPQTVLNDLRAYGLLDDDEVRWWFSLMSPQRGDDHAEELGEQREPWLRFERFVRCLPGPAERRRGLRVLALDVFEDGVCVHLHFARRGRDADGNQRPLPDEVEPDAAPLGSVPFMQLEDDLGTTYRGGGGGGGGSGHADGPLVEQHLQIFAGAVPGGATRLTVLSEGLCFDVAV